MMCVLRPLFKTKLGGARDCLSKFNEGQMAEFWMTLPLERLHELGEICVNIRVCLAPWQFWHLIFIVGHLCHRTSKLTIRLGLMPDSLDMMGNKPHFFSGPVSSLPIPAALIFIIIYAHMFLAAPSSCLDRLTSHEQSKVITIGLQSWLTSTGPEIITCHGLRDIW